MSSILKSATPEGLTGIQIAPTTPLVSHLMFADDCILFCKANVEQAGVLMDKLNMYCQASGQRINYDKSSIHFGKGCMESVRIVAKGALGTTN